MGHGFQMNSSWFEQADATPHSSYALILSLREVFENGVLLNRYLVLFKEGFSWSPTSQVFKIYYYFLHSYLKEREFQKGPLRD
jgi:hypothetical protein